MAKMLPKLLISGYWVRTEKKLSVWFWSARAVSLDILKLFYVKGKCAKNLLFNCFYDVDKLTKYWLYFLAPTGAPLKFKVSNTSSTTLRVTWDRPPEKETHGKIRRYDIRYRKVDCDSNLTSNASWTYKVVSANLASSEIGNLTKWSCYQVQIRAVTILSGVWSETKRRRTSEDGKKLYSLI